MMINWLYIAYKPGELGECRVFGLGEVIVNLWMLGFNVEMLKSQDSLRGDQGGTASPPPPFVRLGQVKFVKVGYNVKENLQLTGAVPPRPPFQN